jgi:hypothetical protein
LQGEEASEGGDSDRPRLTRSNSALGQELDSDEPRIGDDPRSQRGPSEELATRPGVAGDEPSG